MAKKKKRSSLRPDKREEEEEAEEEESVLSRIESLYSSLDSIEPIISRVFQHIDEVGDSEFDLDDLYKKYALKDDGEEEKDEEEDDEEEDEDEDEDEDEEKDNFHDMLKQSNKYIDNGIFITESLKTYRGKLSQTIDALQQYLVPGEFKEILSDVYYNVVINHNNQEENVVMLNEVTEKYMRKSLSVTQLVVKHIKDMDMDYLRRLNKQELENTLVRRELRDHSANSAISYSMITLYDNLMKLLEYRQATNEWYFWLKLKLAQGRVDAMLAGLRYVTKD